MSDQRPDQPPGLMSIYTERAHLLGLLSRLYPSHLYFPDDPEPGFTYGVCIHFPWGQATWHLADEDARHLFLPWCLYRESDYDGHTTESKYAAIQDAIAVGWYRDLLFDWNFWRKRDAESR